MMNLRPSRSGSALTANTAAGNQTSGRMLRAVAGADSAAASQASIATSAAGVGGCSREREPDAGTEAFCDGVWAEDVFGVALDAGGADEGCALTLLQQLWAGEAV